MSRHRFLTIATIVAVTASLCCCTVLSAQTSERDSLLQLLHRPAQDTNRARVYYQLAKYYEKSDLDSATHFLRLLSELVDRLSYERGRYLYHERMAVVYFTQGSQNKALEESRQGLALARRLREPGFESAMLNMMAISYQYLGRYEEELDYVLQAQEKAVEAKDTAKIVALYLSLSNAYSDLGQHRRSVDAGLNGLRLHERYRVAFPYVNRLYAGIAQEYETIGVADSAIYFYDKALNASKLLNDRFAEANIYKYITNFYSSLGRYDKMREMAGKSLVLAKEMKSRQLEATAYYNLAAAYYYTNNNPKALAFVNHALSIAEADSIRHEMQNGYRLLSFIAAVKGNFSLSSRAQRKADSLQQAGLNEAVSKSAADLEKKYETEKKESQIKLQQATIRQKNFLNYILLGSVAAAIIIVLLVLWVYRKKQQLQQQRIGELEKEKQLLATQSLVKGQEDERSRLAKDLHDGLGGLLSGVKLQLGAMKGNLLLSEAGGRAFNLALLKLDEAISEMRRVAHNMMPEALLNMGLQQALEDYCDGLSEGQSFTIFREFYGLEERMEPSGEIVLYRIVQELLNNAIKHAGASRIVAQVIRRDRQVSITIEDNGKGFDVQTQAQQYSAGLRNIQSRVHYLHGQIDIQSAPGKGTSVHIDCLI